jgi:hypothetical protein
MSLASVAQGRRIPSVHDHNASRTPRRRPFLLVGVPADVLLRQAPDEEEDEEEDEDDGKENDDDDDTTDDGYSKARRVQWQIGVRGGRQRPLGS